MTSEELRAIARRVIKKHARSLQLLAAYDRGELDFPLVGQEGSRNVPKVAWSSVGKPVDEGEYPATFTGFKLRKNKDKSKADFYALEFTLRTDDSDDGRKVFRNFSLADGALWALKQLFNTLGLEDDDIADDDETDDILRGLIGTECAVRITHQLVDKRMLAQIDAIASSVDEWE